MKIKRTLPLLAMLAAGSMLCLSGCNVDATNINEEEVSIEEEAEEEDLAEGLVLFHSVWYDADGNILPDVDVAFYDGETLAFSGTTDENGDLETFSLPSNTTLFCSVSDETGNPIAESDVVIKLSDKYESIVIYPTRDVETEEETPTLTMEIPTDEVNLRAGFYVTESETVSLANLTPYVKEETEETAEEATEETAEEQSADQQQADQQQADQQEQTDQQEQADQQQADQQQADQQQADQQEDNQQQDNQQQDNQQQADQQQADQQQNDQQQNDQQQNDQQQAAE